MLNPRFSAILEAANKQPVKITTPCDSSGKPLPLSKYFGENVFTPSVLKKYIPRQQFEEISQLMEHRKPITLDVAKYIADAVKEWAISKGVTHFCHWFQPQTGLTAEKHDSFLSFGTDGQPIESFKAEQLVKGEPDASSFPSGGIRSTFEARGYTAWDPTSPMFINERAGDKTLCIPSVFISYTGEVLDEKTPLLRSLAALDKSCVKLLNKLGFNDVRSVTATLGVEQEYFLVDRTLAKLRPDLIMCGRLLIGSRPAKGQELEDNYFRTIPLRVNAFIHDTEVQLYKLGVPAKTRHNEVAPGQYELAPIHQDASIAADHNQITMETINMLAQAHNLFALLHEKPFNGVNGSGKHSNWSLQDNNGNNLLQPGKTPNENLRFLSVLSCVVRAVYRHQGLLRASVATAGNDRRLGANEAPPAIISIYLGSQLTNIVKRIVGGGQIPDNEEEAMINLGIGLLPSISKDNTDRNRTSPFAFTGNKFEFRAVGGPHSVSFPVAVLNAAVAQSMREFAGRLESGVQPLEIIRANFTEAKSILYEGDNYDGKWPEIAASLGLKNLRTTPEALKELNAPSTIELFSQEGILTQKEVNSKYHVRLESYIKTLLIEITLLKELIDTVVIPVTIQQLSACEYVPTSSYCKRLRSQFDTLLKQRESIDTVHKTVLNGQNVEEKAAILKSEWLPLENELRATTDLIENTVDDRIWPLPKTRELLHIH